MNSIDETIANDMNEYEDIAVRLGEYDGWRSKVTTASHAKMRNVYSDDGPVRALEEFLRLYT